MSALRRRGKEEGKCGNWDDAYNGVSMDRFGVWENGVLLQLHSSRNLWFTSELKNSFLAPAKQERSSRLVIFVRVVNARSIGIDRHHEQFGPFSL